MSHFAPKKCCVETIIHDVHIEPRGEGKVWTLKGWEGDPLSWVNMFYYLHKSVECTDDCDTKEEPVDQGRDGNMDYWKWTEKKRHLFTNCDANNKSASGGKDCECEYTFNYNGPIKGKAFKKWQHFVRSLYSTWAYKQHAMKEILSKRGDKYCKFTKGQIKKCCGKGTIFGLN